jgi:3-dehydroquinate synthetase
VTSIDLSGGPGGATYRIEEGARRRVRELLGEDLGGRRAFVVSDSVVGPLYARAVAADLASAYLELPSGEQFKSWPSVERAAHWLLAGGVERGDLVVAVGGGVITDLVGFTAAITLRGIAWVAVPTTLLAMVDAAIGGKTGIDIEEGKNLLGSFWFPAAVIADPEVLRTLDRRQVRAGLAEVVKAAMIAPAALEPLLAAHLSAVAGGELRHVHDLVAGAVRVKLEVVARDERERGPRAALNLGHTLGHALEAATGYERLLHGEAVAWGLLAALLLARNLSMLTASEAAQWAARVGELAPLPAIADIGWERIEPFILRDKKRAGGRVGWVLPRSRGVELRVPVDIEEARRAFAALVALPPAGPFGGLFE